MRCEAGSLRKSRKVLLALDGVGVHGLGTRGPVGRAHLSVDISELEGLDEAEGLIHRSSNREVVDSDLSEDSSGGDDE